MIAKCKVTTELAMNSISSYDELSTSPNGSMEYIADEIDEDKPKNIIA